MIRLLEWISRPTKPSDWGLWFLPARKEPWKDQAVRVPRAKPPSYLARLRARRRFLGK